MEYVFSDRVKNLKGNAIREIFKLVSRPDVISFAGGLPASLCLPAEQIKDMADRYLQTEPVAMLQYGATEGYMPLRKTIAKFVERCGINGQTVDNALIISGGQQGIDLFIKCFLNEGDKFLVQTPTYLAALHIAKTYQTVPVGVKSNDEGLDLEDLEAKIKEHAPKALYLVPNFGNPTGKTLSFETRKKALEICDRYGILIVEDDPYRELRYSGEGIPSVKSLDKNGSVIYLCSMSKTIAPALRVGAVIADTKVISKLTIGKQATDVHTATLMQAIVNGFIQDGLIEGQLKKAIPVYREKRDCMLDALSRYMPKSFEFTRPDGGLFIWGEFTDGRDVTERFNDAIAKNVAFLAGTDFYADGVSGKNNMRLNFSNATLEQIEKGVKNLGEAFK